MGKIKNDFKLNSNIPNEIIQKYKSLTKGDD